MKKLLLIICCLNSFSAFAQTNGNVNADFDRILGACKEARSSLSNGEGSPKELKQACASFNSVKWNVLTLQDIDTNNEVGLNGHFVFLPNFWNDWITNHKVYKKAIEYQKKANSDSQRRGSSDAVMIVTKAIKAKASVKYGIKAYGTHDVAIVSEVNGLVSWKITVIGPNKKYIVYKDNDDEYRGLPYRSKRIQLPSGVCSIIIEITNTTNKNSSYAIIFK